MRVNARAVIRSGPICTARPLGSSTRVRALGIAHSEPSRACPSSRFRSRRRHRRRGQFLFDRGIYVTLAAYPLVPERDVGVRIQVTAANADDEIEQLCDVLTALSQRFALRREDGLREAA